MVGVSHCCFNFRKACFLQLASTNCQLDWIGSFFSPYTLKLISHVAPTVGKNKGIYSSVTSQETKTHKGKFSEEVFVH